MDESQPGRLTGMLWTTGSSLLIGTLGLIGLIVAARGLGTALYTAFAVLWGVVYGLGGAFAGLQQEVTRSAATGQPRPRSPRMALWSLLLTLPVGLVGSGVTSYVLGPGSAMASALVGVGLVGMGMLTFVCGVLASGSQWPALVSLLVVDAAVRTFAIALLVGAGREDLIALAVVSGSLLWAVLLPLPRYRRALGHRGSGDLFPFARRSLVAMFSAGCAALVVAGLPSVVAALSGGELDPSAGPVVAAATVVRSAFLLLIYGYRPLVLRHFLFTGSSRIGKVWGVCGSAGLLYVLVFWTVGPPAIRMLLGQAYAVSARECALLAMGTTGLGLLVISGLALVASDRHVAAGVGWLVTLIATGALVPLFDKDATAFVVVATVPPWLGVLVHALMLFSRRNLTGSRPTLSGAGP